MEYFEGTRKRNKTSLSPNDEKYNVFDDIDEMEGPGEKF